MFSEEKEGQRCHKCERNLLTYSVKVEILYDNPEKGNYEYTNYYHQGCLLQIKSLARKTAQIQKFDINNGHHVEALSWSYFQSLFFRSPFQPIFDQKTTAEVIIRGMEKEVGFPTEMKLQGILHFSYN